MKVHKHNPHWEEGFNYGYRKKREPFQKLQKHLSSKQIIAVTGLRRVGKTVLMKQMIDHLVKRNIKRENILFFSFDEEQPELDKLINEYSAILGQDLRKNKQEKYFIFLDEAQKLENWQNQVKFYYDNYENFKFFISGSASLFIEKKVDESLAGRIYTFEIPVLSFKEFLYFKNRLSLLKKPELLKEELEKEFRNYTGRNFIEVIELKEEEAKFYYESIINKIVYEDIPALYSVENPEMLKKVVYLILSNPGIMVNYESLSQELGLSSKTLEKYFFYLVKAKLVTKMYNFSRNFLTSERKLKKYYVTAPCFCFLNEDYEIGKIVENLIVLHYQAKFFWRTPQKDEVDIILRQRKSIAPIEVKYKQKIRESEKKPLLKFCYQFKLQEGLMLTKDFTSEEKKIYRGKDITLKFKKVLNEIKN